MTPCTCCGCDWEDNSGPMLHNHLWAAMGMKQDDILCVDCTQLKLGRPLCKSDTTACPWNDNMYWPLQVLSKYWGDGRTLREHIEETINAGAKLAHPEAMTALLRYLSFVIKGTRSDDA